MELKLHANARTTPRTRAQIQSSDLPVAVLAAQFGVSEVTIRRWRKRQDVSDRSHRPHHLKVSLSPLEERLAGELRQLVGLSVDDVAEVLQRCIRPGISRSAVYRSLRRQGLSQRPAAHATPQVGQFEPTPAGFVHVDLKHLPRLEGHHGYVFVAIERVTRFAYVEIVERRDAATIAACLERFLASFGYPVHTILTDNGSEFTDRYRGAHWYEGGRGVSGLHAFDCICKAHGITHKLTRPFTPQTNGMVERFNRRLAKAIADHPKSAANGGKNTFTSRQQRNQYLTDFVHAYNRTRLRCINYETPLMRRNNLTDQYTKAGTPVSKRRSPLSRG